MYATEIMMPGPTNLAYFTSVFLILNAVAAIAFLQYAGAVVAREPSALSTRRGTSLTCIVSSFNLISLLSPGVGSCSFGSIEAWLPYVRSIWEPFLALVSFARWFSELLVISSGAKVGGFWL